MTVHPTDHAGLEVLPFDDCLRLLAAVPVGRVGFVSGGEVLILPVNHIVDGHTVIFRTGSGSKLAGVGERILVGFEADAYDPRTRSGWSVVLSGHSETVDNDAEIDRLTRLGLRSWIPGERQYVVRIRPVSVTGRRTPGLAFAD